MTIQIVQRLLREPDGDKQVIDNLGTERVLLQHMKRSMRAPSYEDERRFFAEATTNPRIIEEIKKNTYVKDNILEDLERINDVKKNSSEYAILREKVIGVSEYAN